MRDTTPSARRDHTSEPEIHQASLKALRTAVALWSTVIEAWAAHARVTASLDSLSVS